MTESIKKAKFIVFEGIDGSGKSSIIEAIKERLRCFFPKMDVTITSELKGTKLSAILNKIIFSEMITPITRSYLFAAMRSQNVQQIIKPNLEKGILVIADRFLDSSLIYQGILEKVGVENVKKINEYAIDCVKPDLVFVLNASIKKSLNNLQKRNATDRFDCLSNKDKKRIIEYYRRLAKINKNYILINVNKEFEHVVDLIWKKVSQIM